MSACPIPRCDAGDSMIAPEHVRALIENPQSTPAAAPRPSVISPAQVTKPSWPAATVTGPRLSMPGAHAIP
jgi:hypothetical protein